MMERLSRWWADWEAFWDEREHPLPVALVRIFLGLCFVYDFAHIWQLGLIEPLFVMAEAGGLSDGFMREDPVWLYRILPPTAWAGHLHHGILLLSAVTFTLGLFTRTSAVTLIAASATFSAIMPYSDRGIDSLARSALCILVFSPAGKTLSLDALIRTGSVFGDGRPEPMWARRLLIGQLVLMYFDAGISKTGITWWPMGHFSALYFALQDPAVAAYDYSSFIRKPFSFFMTQLGAAGTMVYQYTYPLVLLLLWWRRHPERAGRFGRLLVAWRVEYLWIGVGFLFHIILGFSMNLGIFPWAMMSLYPVWLTAGEWERILSFRRWSVAESGT
ncbi:MAG: HTTM domain-containing protein [Alphaproteobacteria bacterium]|nr:HTTM domain-containing protein [Alphaproteobacteria bacterium]